jgi:hypothetical protein
VLAVNCAETIDSLPSALGLDFVSIEYHRNYHAFYPKGWDAEFIFPERFKNHAVLQNAIKLCETRKKLGQVYKYSDPKSYKLRQLMKWNPTIK